jgi:transcriptional/translational regulatory protein YebC/TACO1
VGHIEAEPSGPDADPEIAAIEAGAQDFEPGDEEGTTRFITEPTEVDLVSKALPNHGFNVLASQLAYRPRNPVNPDDLSPEQLEEVEAFLAALDEHDDVQYLYAGLAG